MEYLNLVLRWLHVLSAITIVGSVFYVRYAVLPTLASLTEKEREVVGTGLRKNWAKFLMVAIFLLLATGIANMILIPRYNKFPEGANYGMLVGIKFMLALPVFYIVSLLNGRSAGAAKFREKSRFWLDVAIVLCVAIVVLAGYLRFIPRTPKSDESAETSAARFHPPAEANLAMPVFFPTHGRKA